MTSLPSTANGRRVADVADAIASNIAKVLIGTDDATVLTIVGLLSEGHVLLEDVPGVGKTTLAKALTKSIDGTWQRIQFTPDLLPPDVVGVNLWNRRTGEFEFRAGPVFANVVIADEINRASPKTQSALLEAMAEQQVTVDGTTYTLRAPFLVLATQNPTEHEGTYPLPESQLDRFLIRTSLGYPSKEAEAAILAGQGDRDAIDTIGPVVSLGEIVEAQRAVRHVEFAPQLIDYLVDLADLSRRHPQVRLALSPRATLALQRAGRALAAIAGRSYVAPDDVKALAGPVFSHRMALTAEAQMAGMTSPDLIEELLNEVQVPIHRSS